MRLSFSTLGCPDWGLTRILDTASREGYDGVELRFVEGDAALWRRPELSGGGLRETLRRLQDAGLAISCVDTGSFFHHLTPEQRQSDLDEAKRALELATRLGAPGIRVFGDRVQPGGDLDSTRRWIADALVALCEEAAGGVGVWLESHGDFAPAAATRSVLDLAPGAGVVWDPANAFEENGEAPEEGVRVLGAAIRHVHLKDLKRLPEEPGSRGSRPVLPGTGAFPAARVFAVLDAVGYDGWVSFEWEKKWHPEIEPPEVALPHFLAWAAGSMRRRRDPGPEASRVFRRGRLGIEVYAERPTMGRAAARAVAADIRRLVEADGRAAVIFASAPSQNESLEALRADRDVPWEQVTAFHLDEYVGLSQDHPASFRRFLIDRLFAHVPVAAFHGLDGQAPDLNAECQRYAALLRRHAPGLALLGIGENGHLAFIDPPVCDFAEAADVRQVELDAVCRQQQVNDGAFSSLDEVPRTALSLTVPLIMRVPRAVAIVPGPAKRAAVSAALDGPVTTGCPASILRRHPDATLYLDRASAEGLEERAP